MTNKKTDETSKKVGKATASNDEKNLRRCVGRCNNNVNLKNTDIYGECCICGKLEHFNCTEPKILDPKKRQRITSGEKTFTCTMCLRNGKNMIMTETQTNLKALTDQEDTEKLIKLKSIP